MINKRPQKAETGGIDTATEVDEYDERIQRTGCSDENEDLQMCYARTKDWRLCKKEMDAFKSCFQHYEMSKKNKK